MDKAVKRALEKEAIKLYGINLKQDCTVKFEDMTLSVVYDKEPVEEPVKEVEETVTEPVPQKAKGKGKGRGRPKKKK